jgi:RecJ-like exonuclease
MIDIAALRAQIGFGPRVGIDASTLRALCDALEQSQSRERVLREALGMVIGDIEAGEANHSLSFARAALQAEDTGYSQAAEAKPCDHCSGTGEICCSSTSYAACPDCKGSGEAK